VINQRVLLPLLFATLFAQPALAQINPFRNSSATPLNAADIAALNDATNRLLDKPHLASGNTETWTNPASGASGTVIAGNPTHRKGLACRIMRYQVTVPGPRAERAATLTWCKTNDGWRIG
jgi:surface antigen